MSRYLYATELLITTAPAADVSHDGRPYVNPDYPKGTVLAKDALGDLYRYIGSLQEDAELMGDPRCWPYPRKGLIRLGRNQWAWLMDAKAIAAPDIKKSPYDRAIIKAPTRKIR